MAELADALDLGSSGVTHTGSNPVSRISLLRRDLQSILAFPSRPIIGRRCLKLPASAAPGDFIVSGGVLPEPVAEADDQPLPSTPWEAG